MKKIAKIFLFALVLFIPFMITTNAEEKKTDEKNKINVYLFRGEGCPHCAEAEEWFDELKKDEEFSKYYTLVDYEVWYDEDNAAFMDKVAKKLDTTADGVPFIVVGKKYFSGFAESMEEDIKSAIKEAYKSDNYTDVVSSLKKAGTKKETKEQSAIIPIVIVSGVAIVTVIAMIFLTKEK